MRLRVVTYNIRKGVGADLRRRVDRIADVLRPYEADVIALQEAYRHDPTREQVPQPELLAEELGLAHVESALNVPRRRGAYGNATLSRLPMESATLCLKWRFKKRRSALYTRVQLPGGPLHLFNVHLGLAAFERKIQIQRVADWTDELAGPDDPVVIVGDTNDWHDNLHRHALEACGFVCATSGEGSRANATFPSWYPVGALDRVYLRGGLRLVQAYPARTKLARVASDHLPVIADLEVETS